MRLPSMIRSKRHGSSFAPVTFTRWSSISASRMIANWISRNWPSRFGPCNDRIANPSRKPGLRQTLQQKLPKLHLSPQRISTRRNWNSGMLCSRIGGTWARIC